MVDSTSLKCYYYYFNEMRFKHEMSKRKTYICYSLRLARFLISQGFEVIDIAPNKKVPILNVYFFKNTPELEQQVEKFFRKGLNNNGK